MLLVWSSRPILKLIEGSLVFVVFALEVIGRERPESWAPARTNSSINGRLQLWEGVFGDRRGPSGLGWYSPYSAAICILGSVDLIGWFNFVGGLLVPALPLSF